MQQFMWILLCFALGQLETICLFAFVSLCDAIVCSVQSLELTVQRNADVRNVVAPCVKNHRSVSTFDDCELISFGRLIPKSVGATVSNFSITLSIRINKSQR